MNKIVSVRTRTLLWVASVLAVIVGAVLAVLAMSLAVPEGSPVVENPPAITAPGVDLELPLVQLNGTWSSSDNGTQFVATVGNNVVSIEMVKGDTSMLYWNGTFGTEGAAGDILVSNKSDVERPMLSSADSKDFTVGDDTLSFQFEAMGMMKTVVMMRA